MKSIIVSIHPKWCELIASGKKTIEVRKTAPKETPFKAYIYCTKDKSAILRIGKNVCNGKVIGEFICDFCKNLFFINQKNNCPHIPYLENVKLYNKGYFSCLSTKELCDYLGDKDGYGWHISELKIYDEPKELGEFGVQRAFQSWGYVKNKENL